MTIFWINDESTESSLIILKTEIQMITTKPKLNDDKNDDDGYNEVNCHDIVHKLTVTMTL